MEKTNLSLSTFPVSLKVLATCFVLTLLLGYGVSLLQVYDRTHFEMAKTLLYYRGAEGGEGVLVPPSFATLLSVAHVHTFSQPVMLFLLGLLFVFSRLSERQKVLFILLAFLGSVVSNAAPWLIRYGSPRMTILLPLSQLMLMGSFFVMSLVILYDLWFQTGSKPGDVAQLGER